MFKIERNKAINNLIVYCLGYTLIFPLLMSIILAFLPDKLADMISPMFEAVIYGFTFVIIIKGSLALLKNDFEVLNENFGRVIKAVFSNQCLMYLLNLICNSMIILLTGIEQSNNQVQVLEMLQSRMIFTIVLTVIFAPIVEELVFRGSIFSLFSKKNKNLAIFLASCSFGLLHVISSVFTGDWGDLIYLISYSSMGYCLCRCYIKSGTIYGSILMHAFNNLISVIILLTLY